MKNVALGIMVAAVTSSALASSPTLPVRLLPMRAAADASIDAIRIAIDVEDVEEIDVESRLISGTRTISLRTTGASLFDPNAAPVGALPPPQALVAGKGAVVALQSLHLLSLPFGVYAEHVLVTVVTKNGPQPFDSGGFRYFEVGEGGIVPITVEEYSEKTEVIRTLADGTKEGVGGVVMRPAGSPTPTEVRNAVRER